MRGIPYSDNDPCEWKSRIAVVNGQTVTVYEPITAGAVVNVPALSIGTDPVVTVNTIKSTVDEILADNINAPITCQALLDSANTAVITGDILANGYHTLPPSAKKVHDYLNSNSMTSDINTQGNIKATGTITGKKQFYLTVNSYNSQVNSLPVSLTSNLTSKLNNNGLASLASNWTRFPSWKQDASDDTINTDLNNGNDQLGVFQDVLGGYGVKVKAAGYYKATCQMHFYSTTANTSVAIRFAKNALVDDVQDQDTENPGPCQMSNITANTASSACLSHVMLCAVDDVISVYTSKAGADGTVVTSPASCTLLIEFFGLDV